MMTSTTKDSVLVVVVVAGYIGSHIGKMLAQADFDVVILDNLSTGFADAARDDGLIRRDLADQALLDRLFHEHAFVAVLHNAALSHVGESVQKPARYYRNNVANTLNLLDAMLAHAVQRLIFSSTAAIFEEPETNCISEDHPQQPTNPYGRSKSMVEEMLADYARDYGLRSVGICHFNASGAYPEGELCEHHEQESRRIPLVLQTANSRRDHIASYGNDYATSDGTCVRDYIHVWDLCSALLLALEHLLADGRCDAFNLGNVSGFFVQKVVDAARRMTGKDIPGVIEGRRAGGPAVFVADSRRVWRELGWWPQFNVLNVIIEFARKWKLSTVRDRMAPTYTTGGSIPI